MKAGTKTILFGVHQFLLHPLFVLWAWLVLYRSWPKLYELVAIFIHDLGLWGKPNLDGQEGEQHPEIVHDWIWNNLISTSIYQSKLVRKWSWFWGDVACEVLGHSRYYAAKHKVPVSKLCRPDKLSIAFYPLWLYILLGSLSGEINEYMDRVKNGKYANKVHVHKNKLLWLLETRSYMTLKALEPDDTKMMKDIK